MNTNDDSKSCPRCGALIPVEAPQGLCPKCLLAQAAAPTEVIPPPSAAEPTPTLAEVAAAFPDLEILALIGQGGMGVVYRARQPQLQRLVALKILPRSLGADPGFAERFIREARTLARLSHPNIVAVHNFGQSGGFFYLLMEYVDGPNLRQAMRAGRFTPEQALALVPKICEALQYAHDEGVLHRDIKPENLLLDAKGRVKIADFGIAKLVGDRTQDVTLTQRGAHLGTPAYMAPEQIEHPSEVDHRADIYSLGVVFYEMLTGELPLGRFAAPSSKSAVDARVDEIVFRTLEKEREARFQSAGEVKTRVETLAGVAMAPGAATGAGAGAIAGAGATSSIPRSVAVAGGVVSSPGPSWSVKAVAGAVLVLVSLCGVTLLLFPFYFWARVESSPSARSAPVIHTAFGSPGSVHPVVEFPVAAFSNGGLPSPQVGFIGVGMAEILLLLVPLFLILPGLVGTVLGLMGMREIRDAGGRLRGAGFAVFAGLTWPTLVLDALVLVAVTLIFRGIAGHFQAATAAPAMLTAPLLLGVAVAVPFFAMRRGWQWTTGSGRFSTGSDRAPAATAVPPPAPARDPWPRRLFGCVLAIVLVPALLIGLGLIIPRLAQMRRAPHLNQARITVTGVGIKDGHTLALTFTQEMPPGCQLVNEVEGTKPQPGSSEPPLSAEIRTSSEARSGPSGTMESISLVEWVLPSEIDAIQIENVRRRIQSDWIDSGPHELSPGAKAEVFTVSSASGAQGLRGYFKITRAPAR